MSSALMSCVRESSPPSDEGHTETSEPFSVFESNCANTYTEPKQSNLPNEIETNEHSKRRRFHPLRNLRRIFRRRTNSNVDESRNKSSSLEHSSSTCSTHEKNLHSETLSSTSSIFPSSSPSSPLYDQETYSSDTLLKLNSYLSRKSNDDDENLAVGFQCNEDSDEKLGSTDLIEQTSEAKLIFATNMSINYKRQLLGVAVLSSAIPKSTCLEHENPNITIDCSFSNFSNIKDFNTNKSKQRYKSGCLQDINERQWRGDEKLKLKSDLPFNQLSQSHDCIFPVSSTVNSFSKDLKTELNVLLKRRMCPSNDSLELQHTCLLVDNIDKSMFDCKGKKNSQSQSLVTHKQNDCSLLEFIINKNALNNCLEIANENILVKEVPKYSTMQSIYSTSSQKCSEAIYDSMDYTFKKKSDIDLIVASSQPLSHSAAKHKMAIRPTNKRGPSRIQKKKVETCYLEPDIKYHNLRNVTLNNDKSVSISNMNSFSLPVNLNTELLEDHYITTQTSGPSENINLSVSKRNNESSDKISIHTDEKTYQKAKAPTKIETLHLNSSMDDKLCNNCMSLPNSFTAYSILSQSTYHNHRNGSQTDISNVQALMPEKVFRINITDECQSLVNDNNTSREQKKQSYNKTIKNLKSIGNEENIKLKSGPATRQRYVPQDIELDENLFSEASFNKSNSDNNIFISKQLEKTNKSQINIKKIRPFSSNSTILIPSKEEIDNAILKKSINFDFTKFETDDDQFYETNNSVKKHNFDIEKSKPVNYIINEKQQKQMEKSYSFHTSSSNNELQNKIYNVPSLPDLSVNVSKRHLSPTTTQQSGLQCKNSNQISKSMPESEILKSADNADLTISFNKSLYNGFQTSSDNNEVCVRNIQKPEKMNNISDSNRVRLKGKEYKLVPATDTLLKDINRAADELETCTLQQKEPKSGQFPCTTTSNSIKFNKRSINECQDTNIPEFMKIQLNRVNPQCITKSNIVFSNNIKASIRTSDTRLISNEVPDSLEEINININNVIDNKIANTNNQLNPNEIMSINYQKPKPFESSKSTFENETSNSNMIDKCELRVNQLSLADRKRIFMSEENNLKSESIRKYITKNDSTNHNITLHCLSNINSQTVKEKKGLVENNITLRKRNTIANDNIFHNGDTTPELMKVFARRSLKIKDEDLISSNSYNKNLNENIAIKKLIYPSLEIQHDYMDSNKENQSFKKENPIKEHNSGISNELLTNKDNSIVDGSLLKGNSNGLNNKHSFDVCNELSKTQNNSNKENNVAIPIIQKHASIALFDTKIRLVNRANNELRQFPTEVSKNSDRPCSLTQSSIDRQSVKTKKKLPVEFRSHSTVECSGSSFKGIHQRRAEWEQRAKESLK